MSEGNAPSGTRWLCYTHQTLFALNLVFAIGNALLITSFTYLFDRDAAFPALGFKYFFLRSAAKVSSLLHVGYNPRLGFDSSIGQELTFVISIFSVALLLLVILQAIAGTSVYRWLLGPFAGISAPLAVPAILLLIQRWRLGPTTFPNSYVQRLFWTFIVIDLLCVFSLYYLSLKGKLPLLATFLMFIFHYGFWSWFIAQCWWFGPQGGLYFGGRLFAPLFCLAAFPGSGLVWLLYVRRFRQNPTFDVAARSSKTLLLRGLVSLSLLLILWLPANGGYSVSHPKDIRSLTLTMLRAGGFGAHPAAYTITIHGNGLVEYSPVGRSKFEMDLGPQTATITGDQLMKLLLGF